MNPSDSTNADNTTAIGLVHKESIGMKGNNLLSDWMSRRECHGVIFASVNSCHAPSLVMFLLKKSDILIFWYLERVMSIPLTTKS